MSVTPDTVIEQLDTVVRLARSVIDSSAMESQRRYSELTDEVEQFDEMVEQLGKQVCQDVCEAIEAEEDVDEFFRNELWEWNEYEDDVPEDHYRVLRSLYGMQFVWELEDAYTTDERIEKAQYSIDATKQRQAQIEELAGNHPDVFDRS